MAGAGELQRLLVKAQNTDGGWGYENGSSWTEPTALALLALSAWRVEGSAFDRAGDWLKRTQRADGGWPPAPSVGISTWVTSLATLALSEIEGADDFCRRGIQWLVGQIKSPLNPIECLAFRMRGLPLPLQPTGGSPFFPGTAAWVAPTATSILSLADFARKADQQNLISHIKDAQRYLVSRRCRDGGWNHGGSKYRSENAGSYPETTGLALLALYDLPDSELDISLKRALHFLQFPGSIEGLSWLQLGLTCHGMDVLDSNTDLECRTARDVSLRLLALAAQSRTNKFLIHS
ncbi:MAG: terpene cyclase/mutase family protein [Acidobacteriaceae bacterium]|nr:terpene cyclase/mutase family protein [Acidobacteriaceae bacterium]MBV9294610.1 terpene cyclase/mutase family protein [Acidobacteriaceae bacterium]MBV9764433.1 terpene cyclase/mutase family protein [Acidobacteriaceae bacterium]